MKTLVIEWPRNGVDFIPAAVLKPGEHTHEYSYGDCRYICPCRTVTVPGTNLVLIHYTGPGRRIGGTEDERDFPFGTMILQFETMDWKTTPRVYWLSATKGGPNFAEYI